MLAFKSKFSQPKSERGVKEMIAIPVMPAMSTINI